MDLCLYCVHYKDVLDMERFKEDRFFLALMGIGEGYFKLPLEQKCTKLSERILDDCEMFVKTDRSVIRAMHFDSLSRQKMPILKRIFLKRDILKFDYPFVIDKPYLILFAWVHRAFSVVIRHFKIKSGGYYKIKDKRRKLLEDLGL